MLRSFDNGTIEYFIDREYRIVFARWDGDVRGDELVEASPEIWRCDPAIGQWDAIHDMLDYTGMLEIRYSRELMRLRAELVPGFNPQVRTAVVSADPMKIFEIKVTKATAPDRSFRLFGNNAAALEWLTEDAPSKPGAARPWWFDHKPAGAAVRVR